MLAITFRLTRRVSDKLRKKQREVFDLRSFAAFAVKNCVFQGER